MAHVPEAERSPRCGEPTQGCLIEHFLDFEWELAVLYESYSTATFVIQHSFVLYR